MSLLWLDDDPGIVYNYAEEEMIGIRVFRTGSDTLLWMASVNSREVPQEQAERWARWQISMMTPPIEGEVYVIVDSKDFGEREAALAYAEEMARFMEVIPTGGTFTIEWSAHDVATIDW